MAEIAEKKGFFKRALEKYDAFCQELGIANGACRSCVPIVREDPEPDSSKNTYKVTNNKK